MASDPSGLRQTCDDDGANVHACQGTEEHAPVGSAHTKKGTGVKHPELSKHPTVLAVMNELVSKMTNGAITDVVDLVGALGKGAPAGECMALQAGLRAFLTAAKVDFVCMQSFDADLCSLAVGEWLDAVIDRVEWGLVGCIGLCVTMSFTVDEVKWSIGQGVGGGGFILLHQHRGEYRTPVFVGGCAEPDLEVPLGPACSSNR